DREIARLVHAVTGCDLHDVERELTLVEACEQTDASSVLAGKLADLLAAAHRAPEIVIAQLSGVHADVFALTAPAGRTLPCVVDHDQAAVNPFGRKRVTLVLSEQHAWVRAAQSIDPRAGAALLARILLRQHRLLDTARSTLLLERVLDEIGLAT